MISSLDVQPLALIIKKNMDMKIRIDILDVGLIW
jgi:hypothetical protein